MHAGCLSFSPGFRPTQKHARAVMVCVRACLPGSQPATQPTNQPLQAYWSPRRHNRLGRACLGAGVPDGVGGFCLRRLPTLPAGGGQRQWHAGGGSGPALALAILAKCCLGFSCNGYLAAQTASRWIQPPNQCTAVPELPVGTVTAWPMTHPRLMPCLAGPVAEMGPFNLWSSFLLTNLPNLTNVLLTPLSALCAGWAEQHADPRVSYPIDLTLPMFCSPHAVQDLVAEIGQACSMSPTHPYAPLTNSLLTPCRAGPGGRDRPGVQHTGGAAAHGLLLQGRRRALQHAHPHRAAAGAGHPGDALAQGWLAHYIARNGSLKHPCSRWPH
jgi:hypothetical protein